MLVTNDDLFIDSLFDSTSVKPWKPRALSHGQWPPDYAAVYAWRITTLEQLRSNPAALVSAKAYYSTRPGEFIQHWMDTYNPRKARNKWMPFVFFMRQDEFIDFLEELRRDNASGLVEKCRDIGATWLCCAYSVWAWLFIPDDASGWGSRKQELVDKLGDPDSIFEKMRLLIKRLPDIWLPEGFRWRDHATFMKLINPATGATVTGESGDNIGRGGRKARYFKDESAHYERPEKIEAALGDNTEVQIDVSSVNGLGNVFHRRRESGIDWQRGIKIEPGYVRVFVFDWSHHPEKDQAWYEQRKAKYEREGMLHIFAQEVDRNYSAAVQNTIIDYKWLQACIDAHLKVPILRIPPIDNWVAGFDVAGGDSDGDGNDRNALALRQWVILRHVEEWGDRDPAVSTRHVITSLRERSLRGLSVQYDCIGVGASVKAEYNTLCDDGIVGLIGEGTQAHREFDFVPWNAGAAVIDPYETIIPNDDQSPMNRNFFYNFKAQAWWSFRTRCYKTWRAVEFGDQYRADELISFDSRMSLLFPLLKELAQPTRGASSDLRMLVNKKPAGTRSPNMADAVIQAYFPAPDSGGGVYVGGYSG
jgi:hypothetical protein